jgi:hypothetical protein
MCPGSRSTGEHTPLEGDGEDAVHGVDDEEEVPDHPLLVELQGGALGPDRVEGAALEVRNQRCFSNTTTDKGIIFVGREQRLNIQFGPQKFIWAPCAQMYSLAETPQATPPPPPRIWAHIRGRYW